MVFVAIEGGHPPLPPFGYATVSERHEGPRATFQWQISGRQINNVVAIGNLEPAHFNPCVRLMYK